MPLNRKKVRFQSSLGYSLAGIVDYPTSKPHGFVILAHCFTCTKDLAAEARIAKSLVVAGWAVLRIDFAGLGESEGDFSDSNFSSNVADLKSAAAYLEKEHEAPSIMIGHSLGGTATLAASADIDSVKAVVTIGSPFDPSHVTKQFKVYIDEIQEKGAAEVNLAGRKFLIKQQFLNDLVKHDLKAKVRSLRKSLLVFHAPQDSTVSIDEAAKIYQYAKHPKSFVSLDTANHLLTNKEDAEYVGHTIAAWAARYVQSHKALDVTQSSVPRGQVFVGERNHAFTRSIASDDHQWLADEPPHMGGNNFGPDPYEHLLAALGSCTSMTIRMYAKHKGWPLDNVDVRLEHSKEHKKDCEECDKDQQHLDVIKRFVSFEGDLTQDQEQRLMEIADRCPVHLSLERSIKIETQQESKC